MLKDATSAEDYGRRCKWIARVDVGGGFFQNFDGETEEDALNEMRECYARFGWSLDGKKITTFERKPRKQYRGGMISGHFTGETEFFQSSLPVGVQDLH